MEEETKQQQQHAIFSRLDHILRLLLASIEQLQSTLTYIDGHYLDHDHDDAEYHSQKVMILYKSQGELLQKLRDAMRHHPIDSDSHVASDPQREPQHHVLLLLHQMQKYILLPMILILQRPSPQPPVAPAACTTAKKKNHQDSGSINNNTNNNTHAVLIAQRNAHWRCVEEAALSLRLFVDTLHQRRLEEIDTDNDNENNDVDDDDDDDNDDDAVEGKIEKPMHGNRPMKMDVDLRIKCVVALTESFTGILQDQKTARGSSRGSSAIHLDKGEECMQILLSCLQVLCCNKPPSVGAAVSSSVPQQRQQSDDDDEEEEFVRAIQSCMNGQLLFQMVQCCLSTFEHSNHDDEGMDHDNFKRSMQGHRRLDFGPAGIRGNVMLKVQALQTLDSFMTMGEGMMMIPQEEEDEDEEEDKGQKNPKPRIMGMTQMWRAVFPGVFKVLFRELLVHLRFSTSQSSPRVASKVLETLSILLTQTLLRDDESIKIMTAQTNRTNTSMEMLLAAVASAGVKTTAAITLPSSSGGGDISPELKGFLQNLHRMIPGPLVMIVKLIPNNKSMQTRMAGIVHLCRTILIQTKTTWDLSFDDDKAESEDIDGAFEIKTAADLKTSALECVIIMSVEENERIAKESKEIIQTYRSQIVKIMEWSNLIKEYVSPRITSLVESLPSLAKSGRETELLSAVKLVTGYLVFASNSGEKKKSFSKDILSKFVSHQLSQAPVRRCLVDLFTMDSSAKTSSKLLQYPGENVRGYFNIEYRFMQRKTAEAAHAMLHQMAQVFGYKRSLLFSDECMATLFEALSTRVSHGRSLRDSEHSRWLDKHFGLAVLSKEFLKAFGISRHQKKSRMLNSLTSTIIPIVCSDLMWHIPSSNNSELIKSSADDSHTTTHRGLDTLHDSLVIMQTPDENITASQIKISTEALNGNGALLVCLMDLISTLALNLSEDFKKFIPTVLYPLVQKTSDLNSPSVQDAALLSLHNVSNATGYRCLDKMLHENFSYLMEILVSELSNPQSSEADLRSQAICFYSLHNMIDFMLLHRKETDGDDGIMETDVLLLTDMQASMSKWFNIQFRRSTRDLLRNTMVTMGLQSVFNSSATYLHKILSSMESEEGKKEVLDSIQFQFENLLLEFQVATPSELDITSPDSTKDSFPMFETLDESDEGSAEIRDIKISAHTLARLCRCIEDVLIINSNFLSVPDLKLQTKSCSLFNIAFKLLSTIQYHAKNGDPKDPDITNIGNPLLQSVHKYWPSLQIRFESATTLFLKSYEANTHVTRKHIIYLLSSILEVVSSVSGLCGDFIADKFRSGIWPQVSRLFEHLLMELEGNREESKHSASYSRPEGVLFISMLNCTKSIFSSEECSIVLSSLIPTIGIMIFPLLSQHNNIGETAMDVIKTLVTVDSDCLWRALISASGSTVYQRPLLPHSNTNQFRIKPVDGIDALMADRANILMTFINELPEQNLW